MRLSLTPAGRSVLTGALVVLAAGGILGYAQLVAIGTGGLVVVALATAWLAAQPGIEADRRVEPARVSVGEPAHGVMTIRNTGRFPSPKLLLEDPVGDQVARGELPALRAGQSDSGIYGLPTRRRGAFTVGPLRISHADPFGLVQRSRHYGRVETLFVHPRVHPIDPRPAGRRRDLEGAARDNAPEGGITFHAIRAYQVGDDYRHVHWPSTARTGNLMVRQFVDTSQPRTTVVVDDRSTIHTAESFEVAMDVAASLLAASVSRNFPVELRSVGGLVLGGSHPVPREAFLDALAAAEPTVTGDLLQPLRADAAGGDQSHSLVVVTTAEAGADATTAVTRLAGSFESVTIINVRPDAGRLAAARGDVLLLDIASGAEFARRWQSGEQR